VHELCLGDHDLRRTRQALDVRRCLVRLRRGRAKTVIRNGVSLGVAITNPTVIVEVLSDSTERYERDGKFNAYKLLASLEEYVLVAQHEPSVEVYRRDSNGSWTIVETAKAGGSVTVQGAKLAVDDVYAA
jgi:Uma2 family endonuclease